MAKGSGKGSEGAGEQLAALGVSSLSTTHTNQTKEELGGKGPAVKPARLDFPKCH